MAEPTSNNPFSLVEHLSVRERAEVLSAVRSGGGKLLIDVLTRFLVYSSTNIPTTTDTVSTEDMYRKALSYQRSVAIKEIIDVLNALHDEPSKAEAIDESEDDNPTDLP